MGVDRYRLLAPQLEKNQLWKDYADAIDKTFAAVGIDDARQKLALLRSPMNLQNIVGLNESKRLVALSSVERHERATLVKTADLLGFRFYDRDILDTEDYLRLCLSLGQYYAEDKGTHRFSEFMGFVGNTVFEVTPTWTKDYVEFYKEGDPAIGRPVYRGGDWYPTTHVFLTFGLEKFAGIDRNSLIEFFYYFANINVVLWAIEMIDESFFQAKITGGAAHEIWL